jgi:hypothetical protein
MVVRAAAAGVAGIVLAAIVPATGIVPAAGIVLAAGPAQPEGPVPDAPALPGDTTEARIRFLHDRLRITGEQDEPFGVLAHAMRDNARRLVPFLKRRLTAMTAGSGPDVLHAYQAFGDSQAEDLRRIAGAFDALYADLSESQKRIADAVLREGAQGSVVVPLAPPPFTSALSSPSILYPMVPVEAAPRPEGVHPRR